MFRWLALVAGVCLWTAGAHAQSQTIQPQSTQGCATMQLTNASKAISAANVTALPGSTYPTSSTSFGVNFYVEADYSNSQSIIFCPFGGACSISAGVTMGAGNSRTMRLNFVGTAPTVIAPTSATQQVFVCWMGP